jgi:hypothetical protein
MSTEDVDKLMEPITSEQMKKSVDMVEECSTIPSINPSPYHWSSIYPIGKLDMSRCDYK